MLTQEQFEMLLYLLQWGFGLIGVTMVICFILLAAYCVSANRSLKAELLKIIRE